MGAANSSRWLWIAGAVVAALVLFILFDPGPDQQEKGDALIWERSWRVIEYDPGKAALEAAKSEKDDDKKKKDRDEDEDEESGFNPDDYKGKFRFRMIREPGLYEDGFQTETPRAGRPGAPLVRHTGNLTIRNIFREWTRPEYKGVYDRRSARELDRDFGEDNRRLLFFSKADAEPVIVQIGRKLDNGNTVIKTSADPESLYLIPSFMLQKFDYVFTNYRLKRILYYPTDSYSREITVTRGSDGKKLELRQTRVKDGKKVEQRWSTDEGMEVSLNNASQIDNYVKQIQIDRFDDQAEADGHGDLEKLWEEAGRDDFTVRVAIEGGETVTYRLRGAGEEFAERLKSTPEEKKKTGEDSLLLLRSSNRDRTHLTAGRHVRNLRTKMTRVISEIETKKKNEERKKKAEEAKKKNPPPPKPTPPAKSPAKGE